MDGFTPVHPPYNFTDLHHPITEKDTIMRPILDQQPPMVACWRSAPARAIAVEGMEGYELVSSDPGVLLRHLGELPRKYQLGDIQLECVPTNDIKPAT